MAEYIRQEGEHITFTADFNQRESAKFAFLKDQPVIDHWSYLIAMAGESSEDDEAEVFHVMELHLEDRWRLAMVDVVLAPNAVDFLPGLGESQDLISEELLPHICMGRIQDYAYKDGLYLKVAVLDGNLEFMSPLWALDKVV